MKNITTTDALAEAARKARRSAIAGDDQAVIIAQLERYPLPVVKARTGCSYTTLARIAQVAGI